MYQISSFWRITWKEVQPVVLNKKGFENREKSLLMPIMFSRLIKVAAEATQSTAMLLIEEPLTNRKLSLETLMEILHPLKMESFEIEKSTTNCTFYLLGCSEFQCRERKKLLNIKRAKVYFCWLRSLYKKSRRQFRTILSLNFVKMHFVFHYLAYLGCKRQPVCLLEINIAQQNSQLELWWNWNPPPRSK